jgi:hypothetical protein
MADRENRSGDERARSRRGEYFMLPSEQAEQFKRTEADIERQSTEKDRLPRKDDE